MKSADVLTFLMNEYGAADLAELNKLLKKADGQGAKFRIAGPSLGHYGFTGALKALTETGVKVYDVSKVRLILFSDMEVFEKAKPRSERPVRPKLPKEPLVKAAPKAKNRHDSDEDDDDDDDDDDDIESEDGWRIKKQAPVKPATGSIFKNPKAKRR